MLWRLLLRAVAERTIKRGVGVRLHHGPDGIIVNADGGGGAVSVAHSWQMAVDMEDDQVIATFQRGLVNGMEGMIDDSGKLTPMSQADKDGNLPKLYTGFPK